MFKAKFEAVLAEQKKKGVTVKAVLSSSPNNPLGHVYSEAAIKNVIEFCMENDLDSMSDEIYGQIIYDPAAKWVSTLKLVPEAYKHRVHVTSGFAKDFTLSCFHVGFFHSYNTALVTCGQEISYFSAVSSHTQALLTEMLKAPELPGVVTTSKTELFKTYKLFSGMLAKHGIKSPPAQSGIFLRADMRAYMKNDTPEAEMELWKYLYYELMVNISPGFLFEAEAPGIYRMCFAHPMDRLEELDRRFAKLAKR